MNNKKSYIEPFAHVIIWISIYLVIILFVKTIGPFKSVDHTLLLPVTFGSMINIAIFYITSLFLIPKYSENKKTGTFIIYSILLLLTLTFCETFIDKAFFVYYYSSNQETVISQFVLNFILNLIILSFALAYGFSKNWFKNEKLKQLLIREKLTSDLNFLRSQLNPHFLFNILNMAYSSASQSGDDKTADIIEKLSSLMRYMTYESNVEKIELEKELNYIKNYIDLQKMRFSDEMPVIVNLSINGDYNGIKIAPMIFIQFIENAFKFGTKLGTTSIIEIYIDIKKNIIEFVSKNPIFPIINKTENIGGIGISNVKKRLSLLYPNKHNLMIEKTTTDFIVSLSIILE